ncbi:MAG: response regulator [Clostridiales bacterium]
MEKNNRLNQIKEESRRIFLAETREKLNDVIFLFLKMRINHSLKIKNEVKRFFHSVRGSAATFGFNDLADISIETEKLIDETNQLTEITHKFYSKVLEGFSKVYHELNKEFNKVNDYEIEEFEEESNSVSISSEIEFKDEYIFSLGSGLILVVDDDVSILNLIDKYLREVGFNVVVTSESKDLFEIIRIKKIDLIIMDINMPDFDGIFLLEKIKSSGINIPVIFISSEEKIGIKKKVFSLGAEDYLLKPFEMEELLLRVKRTILNRKNIKNIAYKDRLTGAFLKELFYENFIVAKKLLAKKSESFVVAVVNIDKFRAVNNDYNYDIGNFVLKSFYIFLKNNLTPTDQIYRIYADRFILLFPNSKSKEVFLTLDILRKKLLEFKFDKAELYNVKISFSAGISYIENFSENHYGLIARAEEAMSKAKKFGGNKIIIQKPYEIIKGSSKIQKRANILIIEDSRNIISLIKNCLEELDYDVLTSTNGSTGLLMCQAQKPDLLILDLMLPGIDGFEICQILKNNNETRNIKIIVITSYSSKDVVVKCVSYGVDAFVIKPIQLQELEMRVEKLLGEPNK